jgi:hypothetical protein
LELQWCSEYLRARDNVEPTQLDLRSVDLLLSDIHDACRLAHASGLPVDLPCAIREYCARKYGGHEYKKGIRTPYDREKPPTCHRGLPSFVGPTRDEQIRIIMISDNIQICSSLSADME